MYTTFQTHSKYNNIIYQTNIKLFFLLTTYFIRTAEITYLISHRNFKLAYTIIDN